jgi:farnesyl-diphosphate farnesyltransferase
MQHGILENRGDLEERTWKERLRGDNLPKADRLAFAEFVLTQVSRTFALNIRVLPLALRNHVLYAYLYCRMADTLEDDPLLSTADKVRLLKHFASLFTPIKKSAEDIPSDLSPRAQALLDFSAELPKAWENSTQWEHLLLVHASEVLLPFLDFPAEVRSVISKCVQEMCLGMADFTAKHSQAGGPNLIKTLRDLDTYCYYVAGTVGILLCELFIRHSGRISPQRAEKLRGLCVSFGLGLQLTNILKDLHDDRERDVSWLPTELLEAEQLTFEDFLHSASATEKRNRIYAILFTKAKSHLEDALEYSCLIPRQNMRLRLFCLWPLFMAGETLALLAESLDALVQGVRLKIPRSTVESIVRRTRLLGWSNHWVHAEFRKPMIRLEHALQALAPT